MMSNFYLCYSNEFAEFYIFNANNIYIFNDQSVDRIDGYTLVSNEIFNYNIRIDYNLPNYIEIWLVHILCTNILL